MGRVRNTMALKRRLPSLLAVVLFVVGFTASPVRSAQAAEAVPKNITIEFDGSQYTDGTAEIDARVSDAVRKTPALSKLLFPNGGNQLDTARTYTYSWSLASGLIDDGESRSFGSENQYSYSTDNYIISPAGYYWLPLTEAKGLIGKYIFQCVISKNGAIITTINFRLRALFHEPTFAADLPERAYVYYDAGNPLTISLDSVPTVGGGETLLYRWRYSDDSQIAPESGKPTLTFTPTAAEHKKTAYCWVHTARVGWRIEHSYPTKFILLDRATKPVIMPPNAQLTHWIEFELKSGESKTVSFPAASSGDPQKTLVYKWYKSTADDWDTQTLVQTTDTPSIVITHSGKEPRWAQYTCEAGYREDEDSFLQYPCGFFVEYYEGGGGQEPQDGATRTTLQAVVGSRPVPEAIRKFFHDKIVSFTDLERYMLQLLEEKLASQAAGKPGHKLFDVKLERYDAKTKQWVNLTPGNFPADGADVTLPYPEGTDPWNYEFHVAHMFEDDCNGFSAGSMEYPNVQKALNGLTVRLMGASPVLVYWRHVGTAAASVPKTGDSTPVVLLCALMPASLAGGALLLRARRKRHARG